MNAYNNHVTAPALLDCCALKAIDLQGVLLFRCEQREADGATGQGCIHQADNVMAGKQRAAGLRLLSALDEESAVSES